MNTNTEFCCPLKSEETMELLLDYTAGKLDAVQTAALEGHMALCMECVEFHSAQDAVWAALDCWEAAPVSMDFNHQLWQKIDAEKAAPWYSKAGLRNLFAQFQASAWKPAMSLAAAVLLVTAGFVLDHSKPHTITPSNSDTLSVSLAEAEQLAQTLSDIQLLHQMEAAGSETPAVE